MAPTSGSSPRSAPTRSSRSSTTRSVGDPINAAPNVTGLLFKEQETGYLVGYLAGLVAKNNIKVAAPRRSRPSAA